MAAQMWFYELKASDAVSRGSQSGYYVYFENTLFSLGQTSLKLVLEFRCYVLCHFKESRRICQESFISSREVSELKTFSVCTVRFWTESQPSTGVIFP